MQTHTFDLVIIGSGAGGGTMAHALASTGRRILVIERGREVPSEPENWSPAAVWQHLRYRTTERWLDQTGAEFQPYTHYNVGGNTKFWGSVLYRLRREDFAEIAHRDGVSPAWPITYEDLAPWYDAAERLYQVHGDATADPTEPPRPPFPYPPVPHAEAMQAVIAGLQRQGLHPSALPLGLLDPGLPDLAQRITEIETGLKEAALPEEFRAIGSTARVTRGDAAALLAYRIPALLQASARGTALITDSRRHWAQAAILLVARAGAMEVYPNHTFQPGAGMTRGEFAAVVMRVLNLVAARSPKAAERWKDARLGFADVRPGHTLSLAISRAVASGVMRPLEGQTFGISRPMTGADAVEAIDRLTRLVDAGTADGLGNSQRGARRP